MDACYFEREEYNREYRHLEHAINISSKAWARYFHISARNKQRINALLEKGKRQNDAEIRTLKAKTRLAYRKASCATKKADTKTFLEAKVKYESAKAKLED